MYVWRDEALSIIYHFLQWISKLFQWQRGVSLPVNQYGKNHESLVKHSDPANLSDDEVYGNLEFSRK